MKTHPNQDSLCGDRKSPLVFAKLELSGDKGQFPSCKSLKYLKLQYPNGVSLTLPVDIDPLLLKQYIHLYD